MSDEIKMISCDTLVLPSHFFKGTEEQICKYLEDNVDQIRQLNEVHSCEFSYAEGMIYIEGDEDWHEITVRTVKPTLFVPK